MFSKWVGSRLEKSFRRSIAQGEFWGVSMNAWYSMPWRVRNWTRHWVTEFVGDAAAEALAHHPALSSLGAVSSNSWSISAATRIVLHSLLLKSAPPRIIEFGSGVSTLIFATYAAGRNSHDGCIPSIVSIEHDRDWMEETRRSLEERGVAKHACLVHAPIIRQEICGMQSCFYSIDCVKRAVYDKIFDMCFIDGPPAAIGRRACLPLIAPHLADGSEVLLDDALRAGEQAAWIEWIDHYRGSLKGSRLILTDRGLASGVWRAANIQSPTPQNEHN